MLFSTEYDHGTSISFYLVPDTGGTVPSVRVLNDGVEVEVIAANRTMPELIAAGRHATGQVVFMLDESTLPGIAGMTGLEIEEAESGLPIYRRPRPDFLKEKVYRIETHLLPLWRIDDSVRNRFQYWYRGIDRRGYETSTQVFCIGDLSSAYISGRLFIKTIEQYLASGFKTVVLFRDPYEELAERLIILKNASPKTRELLGPRDALTFEPVMDALTEFERLDEDSCRRFFKRSPAEITRTLANPFVRQLTCGGPDDMPRKTAIAQALLVLSSFEIVSLRSDAAHFSQALGEMLGLGTDAVPVMNEYGRVSDLARTLRTINEVEGLIDYDLNIYEQTKHAFGSIT